MGIWQAKKSQAQRHPVFLEILEETHGGVMIEVDSRIPSATYTLFAGCPIATCATQGQFMFIKTAQVTTAKADGATAIAIEGPNLFKVGDFIGIEGMGAGTTATITVVTATKIATALTNFTLTKGAIVYEAAADGATAPKYEPFGLLKNDTYVKEADGTTIYNATGSLVLRGAVAASNYPLPYGSIVKGHSPLSIRMRYVSTGDK